MPVSLHKSVTALACASDSSCLCNRFNPGGEGRETPYENDGWRGVQPWGGRLHIKMKGGRACQNF